VTIADQRRIAALERLLNEANRLNEAVKFATPERRRGAYRSVRSVEALIGQRISIGTEERIVGVSPGYNGKIIVWVEMDRSAPVSIEEADRTPEGERAVTEEVSP